MKNTKMHIVKNKEDNEDAGTRAYNAAKPIESI
jgi:hypothetical protein